jgi:hypothetical protein
LCTLHSCRAALHSTLSSERSDPAGPTTPKNDTVRKFLVCIRSCASSVKPTCGKEVSLRLVELTARLGPDTSTVAHSLPGRCLTCFSCRVTQGKRTGNRYCSLQHTPCSKLVGKVRVSLRDPEGQRFRLQIEAGSAERVGRSWYGKYTLEHRGPVLRIAMRISRFHRRTVDACTAGHRYGLAWNSQPILTRAFAKRRKHFMPSDRLRVLHILDLEPTNHVPRTFAELLQGTIHEEHVVDSCCNIVTTKIKDSRPTVSESIPVAVHLD